MKILHISTISNHGAGKSALRLHLGLKSLGLDSKMLTLNRHSIDNDVIRFETRRTIFKKAIDRVHNKLISLESDIYRYTRPKDYDLFSNSRTIYNISKHPLVREADIITLRWIAFMVDYKEFFHNINGKPIIWRLSDMNPFTGGCHYSNGCIGYQTGCGICPQLGSKDSNDLSKRIIKRKEKAYRKQNMRIVAISKQHAGYIKSSYLFENKPIEIIPNGIPTDVFKKRHDKESIRKLLGIPQGKTAILYGADSKIERKGFEYLLKALGLLKQRMDVREIALVTFGPTQSVDSISKGNTFSIHQLGYITDEILLSNIYSSCDFFVMPSTEEAGGQTFLEAMACEIPVIAFNVGTMAEAISPHKTGFLAELKNTEDLADKVEYMILHPREREQMGENARKLIEQQHALQTQAKRYLKLYEMMLKEEKTPKT